MDDDSLVEGSVEDQNAVLDASADVQPRQGAERINPLESFRKHLICPRCKKLFERPKTLSCLDTFCEECLQRDHEDQRQRLQRDIEEQRGAQENNDRQEEETTFIGDLEDYRTIPSDATVTTNHTEGSVEDFVFQNDPNYFQCPLDDCDGTTQVSLTSIDQLDNIQVNLPLSNIERTVLLKEDLPKGRVLCGACQEQAAIGVCCNKTCSNRPFCGRCMEVHLRERRNEKHCIVYPQPPGSSYDNDPMPGDDPAANDGTMQNWNTLQQGGVFCHCRGHENHLRDIYCVEHDEVVCLRCVALDTHHAGCATRYATEDIYPECVRDTKMRLEEVDNLHHIFKGALITTDAIERALAQNVDSIKDSIRNRYAELEMQLQNERDDLLRKAGRAFDLKSNELKEHHNMLQRVTATLSRCVDFVTDFIATAIPAEFMMLKTQINNRLDQLLTRYTNYHRTPLENDCVYFEKNKNFDMSNAIGSVFSTPSTKKFLVHPLTPLPLARKPSYFAVTARDILKTNINGFLAEPTLCVTIRHLNDQDCIEGCISYDKVTGKYFVTICPYKSGQHEICIYEPMGPPYERCYVGGRKIIVNVGSGGLLSLF